MRFLEQAEVSGADRTDNETQELVKAIIANVRERGDEAVLTYERSFSSSTREAIRVSDPEIEETLANVDAETRDLVDRVVDREVPVTLLGSHGRCSRAGRGRSQDHGTPQTGIGIVQAW